MAGRQGAAVNALAVKLATALSQQALTLATAESCTGGLVSATLTDIAGSSTWFDRGFVTYSNQAKSDMLGVRTDTVVRFGAVSEETAREMAAGALANSQADWAISITGIAGPGGGSSDKPVGTVCFAWCQRGMEVQSEIQHYAGDRQSIRQQALEHVLMGLLLRLDA